MNTFLHGMPGERPTRIEQALIEIHTGQWFTWTDSKNKTYANLRLTEKVGIDGKIVDNLVTELPTEEEVNAKLVELQEAWDIKNAEYKINRKKEYPSIQDLVVALYDTEDKLAIENKRAEVKAKYPK